MRPKADPALVVTTEAKKKGPLSPRRRSILNRVATATQIPKSTEELEAANDDEAERAALLEEERSRTSQFSTPASSASRRSVVSEISSPQKEHYQGCLKLYAENKINKDNAWNLQLIDFMSAMLRKHDSRMENLQVASTTLDASARIYSYRVDAIHHDVLKMAGGLSKAVQAKRGKRTEEEEENMDQTQNNGDDDNNMAKKKEKRKRAPKSSLSTNVAGQLNGEIEVNECIDSFFAQLAATTGDTTSSNRAFNATLPIDEKTLAIILRSDVDFIVPNEDSDSLDKDNLNYLSLGRDCKFSVGLDDQICSSFHGFSINDWDPDNENVQNIDAQTKTTAWVDNLNLSQQNAMFDINADVEPLPNNESGDGFVYDEPNDAVVSDDEEAAVMGNAIKRDRGKMVACLVDARPSTQADMMLEYSYSNVVIGAWAGPSHWKLKNNMNKGAKIAERSQTLTSVVTKKTVSRKNREIDFIVEGVAFDGSIEKYPQFAPVPPGKIMLGRKTLVNGAAWNEKKFKTPVDRGYNMNFFRKFNLRETVMLSLAFDKPPEKEDNRISDVLDYDYNNENDTSYCPNSQPDNGGCEPWIDDEGNIRDVHQDANPEGGMEMVEPPPKVAKIFIPYALRAKKVDMKQLKNVTWKLLTVNNPSAESDKENHDVNCETVSETTFSDLYKKLPTKLSSNMRESLSVSLSLLAVLHLANEKGLTLENNSNFTDFNIQNLDKC